MGKAFRKENATRLKEVKVDIQNSFDRVKSTVVDLVNSGGFSFDALNSRLEKGLTDTINTAFEVKIKKLEEESAIGSADMYQCAIKSFARFGGDKISYDLVTTDWLKRYEKHMLAEDRSYTTIAMYMRAGNENEIPTRNVLINGWFSFWIA